MAVTLRYFTEFGEPSFQHMTAYLRIELVMTHRIEYVFNV